MSRAEMLRAVALHRAGQHREALQAYARLLKRFPDDFDLLHLTGVIHGETGRHASAVKWIERALSVRPDSADAHANLANELRETGEVRRALEHYRRALELDPGHVAAWINLANLHAALDEPSAAEVCYGRALALEPNAPDARFGLGNALRQQNRHAESSAAFAAVRRAAPDFPYAEGFEFHARQQCADWTDYLARLAALEAGVRAGRRVVMPFDWLAISASLQDQRACAQTFATDRHAARALAPASPRRTRGTPLRLGYLSADFHEHATAHLVAGLFEAHDRTRFHVSAFSYGPPRDDPLRRRIAAGVDAFVDVRLESDAQIAARVREHGIDILVDLKGYTRGGRPHILALRAAPIQVSYLGYPGTLGSPAADYLIADAVTVPDDAEEGYSERIVRLPGSYQVNDALRVRPSAAPPRAALGLPEDGFVFCCFNNTYKITPDIFAVWMTLLGAVEGSVLWLYDEHGQARANLTSHAAAAGIDSRRLVFAAHLGLADHLARYLVADLFLDTAPYNAHTTASDALWMGLPVVTVRGTTFAGRVAASLLASVALDDLVADGLAGYAALARRLATERGAVARLREHLERGRGSFSLFDTRRFCGHLELAYGAMWQRHARGEAPATIDLAVPPSEAASGC